MRARDASSWLSGRAMIGGEAVSRWSTSFLERFGEPLAVFVVIRLALSVLVYFGHILMPFATGLKPGDLPRNLLIDGWRYWDGGWYLSIVEVGYYYVPPPEMSNVAFFPLFPMLIRVANLVVGDSSVAGLLVANLSFALALCLLHSFVRGRWGREVAFRTIILLVVYPFGFYLGALYTESLFLLLAVASFWLAEREKWWLAALAGMLCVLTRQMGIALAPALLILYLQKRRFNPRRIGTEVLALGLIPLGLAAYMAYLYLTFGDPLAFYKVTIHSFGHLNIFREDISMIDPRSFGEGDFGLLLLMNLVFGALFLLLAVPILFRLGPAYAVFVALAAGIPLSVGLISLGRYMVVVFPVYILLAQLIRRPLIFQLVAACSALVMGLLAVLFANRYWVF